MKTMLETPHWHATNGSSGCMPDSNEVHETEEAAIYSLRDSFDVMDGAPSGMIEALRETGIYYFDNPAEAGADYAQVYECSNPDCMGVITMANLMSHTVKCFVTTEDGRIMGQ